MMRRLYLQVYLAFLGILLVFAVLVALRLALRAPRTADQAGARRRGGARSPSGCPRRGPARASRRRSAGWPDRRPEPHALERGRAAAGRGRARGCRSRAPRASAADGWPARGGPVASCGWPTAAGWWPASGSGASPRRRACSSSSPCSPRPWPSAPSRWRGGSRGGSSGCAPASRAWAAGDLCARVPVEGRDEVAELARSFNRAADRIEALVGAQRTLLASASHELRSPLARIAWPWSCGRRPARPRAACAADIAELDELIEELLLASRLEAVPPIGRARTWTCSAWWRRRRLASTRRWRAGRRRARRGAAAAAAGAQPAGERAAARGGTPVEVMVEPAGGRAGCASATAARACPRRARADLRAFYRPTGRRRVDGGRGSASRSCAQIARRHGGEARYVAREGGGSCFEVELPVV